MLAMDMGTGKTRCIVELTDGMKLVLILCPKSVLPVWHQEFLKFSGRKISNRAEDVPDVLVLTCTKGSTKKKVEQIVEARRRQAIFCADSMLVVVVNYETFIQSVFLKHVRKAKWDLMVLDESHRVKQATGKTSKAVTTVQAKNKICLTGTPMPHSLLDIYGQARFLDPRIFSMPSWFMFRAHYAVLGVKVPKNYPAAWQEKLLAMPEQDRAHCMALLTTMKFKAQHRQDKKDQLVAWLNNQLLPPLFGQMRGPFTKVQWDDLGRVDQKHLLQVVDYKNVSEFEARLATFVFQVKADDVLDLPESQDIRRPITLEPKTQKVYDEMDREFVADLSDGRISSAANVLVKLLRLQQVTGGHVAVDEEEDLECIGLEKMTALHDLLEDIDGAEPVVVFARFTADLKSVENAAILDGRAYYELSGHRNDLKAWQDADDGGVIGVQIQAGGVGISLVRARYCIYYSLGFSLGDYLQSRARVHRPGQERPVSYIHLVAQKTIDERVYMALSKRKQVVDEVMANVAASIS